MPWTTSSSCCRGSLSTGQRRVKQLALLAVVALVSCATGVQGEGDGGDEGSSSSRVPFACPNRPVPADYPEFEHKDAIYFRMETMLSMNGFVFRPVPTEELKDVSPLMDPDVQIGVYTGGTLIASFCFNGTQTFLKVDDLYKDPKVEEPTVMVVAFDEGGPFGFSFVQLPALDILSNQNHFAGTFPTLMADISGEVDTGEAKVQHGLHVPDGVQRPVTYSFRPGHSGMEVKYDLSMQIPQWIESGKKCILECLVDGNKEFLRPCPASGKESFSLSQRLTDKYHQVDLVFVVDGVAVEIHNRSLFPPSNPMYHELMDYIFQSFRESPELPLETNPANPPSVSIPEACTRPGWWVEYREDCDVFDLSVVMVVRNDNHGFNLIRRVQKTLEVLAFFAHEAGVLAEVIIVEYNPPTFRPSISEVISRPETPLHVRIITVPASFHAKLKFSSYVEVAELHGKNIGFRRARGRFVAGTNPDDLWNEETLFFIGQGNLVGNRTFYRIARADTAAGTFDKLRSVAELVEGVRSATDSLHPYDFAEMRKMAHLKDKIKSTFATVCGEGRPPAHIDPSLPLTGAASGDFTLMSRSDWFISKGYAQVPANVFVDGLLLHELRALNFTQVLALSPCLIMHQHHVMHMPSHSQHPVFNHDFAARIASDRIALRENGDLRFSNGHSDGGNWGYPDEVFQEQQLQL